MEYALQQANPARKFGGIAFVIMLHAVLVYALVNGLARKVVEVVKGPLETKIIQELKPPPAEPPPPPPKLLTPPPPFIPPPEVNITQTAPAQNTIASVTTTPPPAPVPVQQEAPKTAAHVGPVVRSSSCREPEYPAAAARLGETGEVVLSLLVGVNGRVVDSRIEKSSGSPRLDQAARQALSLCQFTPGTADGQPEEAWGRLAYA
ncbi:MAG TPA: energy transducer TonB, partial [Nevskia sp.]|nr:energy transducer TonB [Nevskia sp.]